MKEQQRCLKLLKSISFYFLSRAEGFTISRSAQPFSVLRIVYNLVLRIVHEAYIMFVAPRIFVYFV